MEHISLVLWSQIYSIYKLTFFTFLYFLDNIIREKKMCFCHMAVFHCINNNWQEICITNDITIQRKLFFSEFSTIRHSIKNAISNHIQQNVCALISIMKRNETINISTVIWVSQ